MSRYLIKLKPLDKFFFGGNITFGEGEDSKYLVKSNLFPQQTQILGMLRRELLVQNKLLTLKRKGEWVGNSKVNDKAVQRAKELVGEQKFDLINKNFDLKKIKEISPVFLVDNQNRYYQKSRKDYGFELEEKAGKSFATNESNNLYLLRDTEKNSYFNAKDGLKDIFLSSDEAVEKNILSPKECEFNRCSDCVFIADEKIGIQKSKDGKSEDKAFFKMTSYRLNSKFRFAFIVDFDDEIKIDSEKELENSIVYLGAERSSFKLEVQKIDKSFEDIFAKEQKSKRSKLTLLGDSYLDMEDLKILYKKSYFQISNSIDFQYIQSESKKRNKDEDTIYSFEKSSKYNLIERGSVFYIKNEDIEDIEKLFNKYKTFTKIGYNRYIITKGDEDEK